MCTGNFINFDIGGNVYDQDRSQSEDSGRIETLVSGRLGPDNQTETGSCLENPFMVRYRIKHVVRVNLTLETNWR